MTDSPSSPAPGARFPGADPVIADLREAVRALARGLPPAWDVLLVREVPVEATEPLSTTLVEHAREAGFAVARGRFSLPASGPFEGFREAARQLALPPGTAGENPGPASPGPLASLCASGLGCAESRAHLLQLAGELFTARSREPPLLLLLEDLEYAGSESFRLLEALAGTLSFFRDERTPGTRVGPPPRLLIVALLGAVEAARATVDVRRLERGLRAIASPCRPGRVRTRALYAPARGEEGHPSRAPDSRAGDEPPCAPLAPSGAAGSAGEALSCLLDLLAAAGACAVPTPLLEAARSRLDPPAPGEGTTEERAGELAPILRAAFATGRIAPVGEPGATVARARWIGEAERRAHYDAIDPARRKELHRAWAEAWRAAPALPDSTPAHEAVAWHARRAGLRELQRDHAFAAAEARARAGALVEAIALEEDVLETLAAAEALPSRARGFGPTRAEVVRNIARLQRARGRSGNAVQCWSSLLAPSAARQDRGERSAILREIGEIHLEAGDQRNARQYLRKAIRTLEPERADPERPLGRDKRARHRANLCRARLALARLEIARQRPARARPHVCATFDALAGDPRAFTLRIEGLLLRAAATAGPARSGSLLSGPARDLAEAERLAEKHGEVDLQLRALRESGRSRAGEGDHAGALERLERGLEIALSRGRPRAAGKFLREIAAVHHDRGRPRQALVACDRALELALGTADSRATAGGWICLGRIHRLREENDRAAELFRRATDLSSRHNDQGGVAIGWTHLSAMLEREGRYDEALDYAFRGLEQHLQNGSRAQIAYAYYRVARVYRSRGDLESALAYARRCHRVREGLADRAGMAWCDMLLAEIHRARGALALSHRAGDRALEAFESLDNPIGAIRARAQLALLLLETGEVEGAETTIRAVLEAARQCGQRTVEIVGRRLLARAALESGESGRAENEATRAERAARSLQSPREQVETSLLQCEIALEQGRAEEANRRLEEAYSQLERGGPRDLIPEYFLSRARLELLSARVSEPDVEKYLERGRVEASEGGILPLQWRIWREKGNVEARRNRGEEADEARLRARAILEELRRDLPRRLVESFWRLREREALLRESMPKPQPRPPGDEPPASAPPREAAARPETTGAEPEAAAGSIARGGPAAPTAPPARLDDLLLTLHEAALQPCEEGRERRLLERTIDATLELAAADHVALLVRQPRGGEVVLERWLSPLASEGGPEGVAPCEEESAAVAAARTCLLGVAGDPTGASDDGEPRRLALPISSADEVLGAICVEERGSGRVDAQTRGDLERLLAHAAVALKGCRSLEWEAGQSRRHREGQERAEAANIKLRQRMHRKVAELSLTRADRDHRQRQLEERYDVHGLVGESEAMSEVFVLLERYADTLLPVLLLGESGTGKDLVARVIHFRSGRAGNFVSVNCAAVPETLIETELFGHEQGAFTGAVSAKRGLVELAAGGTLFLDDIAETSPAVQQKLLRVLESGEFRRVGGKATRRTDIRTIATSSRSLEDLVEREEFREDLFYRLDTLRIRLPPLRERTEDVPLLVEHFLCQVARREGTPPRRLTSRALAALQSRPWPGNVRELRNVVERSLLVSAAEEIDAEALGLGADGPRAKSADAASSGGPQASWREAKDAFEREYIRRALRLEGGNVARAAKASGLSRESFYRLLRKHRLTPARRD